MFQHIRKAAASFAEQDRSPAVRRRHGVLAAVAAVALSAGTLAGAMPATAAPVVAAAGAQQAPAIPSTVGDFHSTYTDIYYQRPWVQAMGPYLDTALDWVDGKAAALACSRLPSRFTVKAACEELVSRVFAQIGATQLKKARQLDACVRVRFLLGAVYGGHSVATDPKFCLRKVGGAIGTAWMANGGRNGALGYATTDETPAPDGVGRFVHFLNGSIYWSPSTGAHVVKGLVKARWEALGWERGVLGYPTTDEITAGGGRGVKSVFQHGEILFSPSTGAHAVYGSILAQYRDSGGETSRLGFPTTDEFALPGGGRQSSFENGCRIEWRPGTPGRGTYVICN